MCQSAEGGTFTPASQVQTLVILLNVSWEVSEAIWLPLVAFKQIYFKREYI